MTVRVALVGCGFIGTVHSFALKALTGSGLVGARVVAACDPDLERAERTARAHPGATATAVVAEAVAAADAVWVCTPTAGHLAAVEAAAAAGAAVYCEKPLAPDLAGAVRLVEAVGAAGVPGQVGLVLRSALPAAALADLAGAPPPPPAAPVPPPTPERDLGLGAPLAAVLRDDQYFPVQGMYGSTWRADRAVAGGGTLLEHSIHDLDLLAWVLGPVVSVTARTANHAGHDGIEDVAAAVLTHASGATSTLLSVWHGLLTRPSTRHLEVFFETGLATVDDEDGGPVVVEHRAGTAELALGADAEAYLARLAVPEGLRRPLLTYVLADHGFLTALGAGSPPWPSLQTGLDAHRVADACYRSAAAGGAPVDPRPGPGAVVSGAALRED